MGLSDIQLLSPRASVRRESHEKSVDSCPSDGGEGAPDPELTFKAHPLGVKPSGNALAASENSLGNMGFFGALPDETILVLLEWLDSKSLLNLGASCRGFYAYTTCDQLWKDLFIMYAEFLFLYSSRELPYFTTCVNPDLVS